MNAHRIGSLEKNDEVRLAHSAGLRYVAYSDPSRPDPARLAAAPEADRKRFAPYLQLPAELPPRVIALAEQASIEAIAGDLPEGRTTVGYQVQLAHLTPTAVGGTVVAEATLEQVEGRRLTFRVSVNDARGLVAAGRITRVIVERARFLERAQSEG